MAEERTTFLHDYDLTKGLDVFIKHNIDRDIYRYFSKTLLTYSKDERNDDLIACLKFAWTENPFVDSVWKEMITEPGLEFDGEILDGFGQFNLSDDFKDTLEDTVENLVEGEGHFPWYIVPRDDLEGSTGETCKYEVILGTISIDTHRLYRLFTDKILSESSLKEFDEKLRKALLQEDSDIVTARIDIVAVITDATMLSFTRDHFCDLYVREKNESETVVTSDEFDEMRQSGNFKPMVTYMNRVQLRDFIFGTIMNIEDKARKEELHENKTFWDRLKMKITNSPEMLEDRVPRSGPVLDNIATVLSVFSPSMRGVTDLASHISPLII